MPRSVAVAKFCATRVNQMHPTQNVAWYQFAPNKTIKIFVICWIWIKIINQTNNSRFYLLRYLGFCLINFSWRLKFSELSCLILINKAEIQEWFIYAIMMNKVVVSMKKKMISNMLKYLRWYTSHLAIGTKCKFHLKITI